MKHRADTFDLDPWACAGPAVNLHLLCAVSLCLVRHQVHVARLARVSIRVACEGHFLSMCSAIRAGCPFPRTTVCAKVGSEQQEVGRCTRCRAQKVVETMVTDLGCAPPPKFPTRAVAGAWLALRAEAAALQELRRKVKPCAPVPSPLLMWGAC